MKQIVQNLKSGETILEEVPVPKVQRGCVLIKTYSSLVSLGTERMLVEFGKANFISKARKQPDKVKQVLEKIKADGLKPTMETVFRKLGEPLPLGYCNAGEVIGIGKDVDGFKIGDRVISNGNHAEVVCVPKNLVAKIPDGVSYDEASFTVIGSIALQGVRLIKPTFGETIVVVGLGLIGLLTVQILNSNGCNVIGLDFSEKKVNLAKSWGISAYQVTEDVQPDKLINSLTNQIGCDGVIITASTKSNEVISQAAKMCRKRGRIILVGVIGLNMNRADFYEKELTFQVSCSYGPGRYDDDYETKGIDYPISFVRWTEKRNFEAILFAIHKKKINVLPLITESVDLVEYNQIYENMSNSNSIASILKYSGNVNIEETTVKITDRTFDPQKGIIGIIGAGNFTKATIVPNLKKLKATIKTIASARGLSGTLVAKSFGIHNSTTNYQDILSDDEIDVVLITTRHNSHAKQVLESIKANKHVFVEKPLALSFQDIDKIQKAYENSTKSLTVGFNRRFSPFSIDAKKQLGNSNSPINVIATMNAGFIPDNHWVQDMEIGGGRIIGEACHLIDLITYFTGAKVTKIVMNALGLNPKDNTDNASLLLHYDNGSQGVINYFSNGNKAYSKERIEIFSQNKTLIIDNFRKSTYYGCKSSGMKRSQDKGHNEQFRRLIDNVTNGKGPIIPFDEILNTSKASIAALESLKKGEWVDVK